MSIVSTVNRYLNAAIIRNISYDFLYLTTSRLEELEKELGVSKDITIDKIVIAGYPLQVSKTDANLCYLARSQKVQKEGLATKVVEEGGILPIKEYSGEKEYSELLEKIKDTPFGLEFLLVTQNIK